jgi:hypothetical protein
MKLLSALITVSLVSFTAGIKLAMREVSTLIGRSGRDR